MKFLVARIWNETKLSHTAILCNQRYIRDFFFIRLTLEEGASKGSSMAMEPPSGWSELQEDIILLNL
jgi:hypothetical protein